MENLQKLLNVIACPKTKQSLRFADVLELKSLNDQIQLGQVTYANGEPVEKSLACVLINLDNKLGYEVAEGIPILLEDYAIILSNK